MDDVEEHWEHKLLENKLKLDKRNDNEMSKLMIKMDKKDKRIEPITEEKNKR